MRTKYQLWKVSNGWLLVPEGRDGQIVATDAPLCSVFKSLKEFAEFKPKRERKRGTMAKKLSEILGDKPTSKEIAQHAN